MLFMPAYYFTAQSTDLERMEAGFGYTNLYVKNFEKDVTEETLLEKFSVFGTITSLVISKDYNGISKGFGFVNYEKHEDAIKAKEAMHGAQLGSKVLYVARAQKKGERQLMLQLKYQGLNLYVKHINDGVDEEKLKEYFKQCGTVTSVRIMRTDKGISRGFGFVCFSMRHEALRAIQILNGVLFHGKPLYVAMAQTREERKRLFLSALRHPFTNVEGLQGPFNPTITPPYAAAYHNRLLCPMMIPGYEEQNAVMMNPS